MEGQLWAELVVGKASSLPFISRVISGDGECILACGCRLKSSCCGFVSETESWDLQAGSALVSQGAGRSTRCALNLVVPRGYAPFSLKTGEEIGSHFLLKMQWQPG